MLGTLGFECLLRKASQKSCLASCELGGSEGEYAWPGAGRASGTRLGASVCSFSKWLLTPVGKGTLMRCGLCHQDSSFQLK